MLLGIAVCLSVIGMVVGFKGDLYYALGLFIMSLLFTIIDRLNIIVNYIRVKADASISFAKALEQVTAKNAEERKEDKEF